MKSSSALDGLDEGRFLVEDFGLTGLGFGEGATLPMVLFAGLVWLDWLAWLEWLVFGL